MTRVRLADVAERAGVSMKTVSNVVHNYPHVTPAMRAKVQRAIDELGYRPNLTARRLATGKTGTIALAIPEIDHPYFSEVSRQIAEEANRRGLRVLFEQTLNAEEAEQAVLHDRETGLVDGVIFHPVTMNSLTIARLAPDTPLVLLGESARPLTTDHVMIDNVAASADATRHLIALGRRRIAFLAVVDGDVTGSTARRLEGYQAALIEAGITEDASLVLTSEGFSSESAKAAVHRALTSGARFDGIVSRDDRMAVGALQALHEAEVEIPDQVAVIGWDDTALSAYTHPTLTSISPDKAELAAVAIDMLIERINGHQGAGRHRIVGHSIAVRESAPAS